MKRPPARAGPYHSLACALATSQAVLEPARPRKGRGSAATPGSGPRGLATRVAATLDPSEAANAMLGLRQPNVAGAPCCVYFQCCEAPLGMHQSCASRMAVIFLCVHQVLLEST